MFFEASSEKDSTLHNLKLTGSSKIQIHVNSLCRKQSSSTKQEHKIQYSLINVENFTEWPDIVFRYYEDTDNLAIYFVKVTPGVVDYCDNATNDILISYTHDHKIISIDIDGVSSALQCHMFNLREEIDGKPPITLNLIYYEESDILKIYFVDHMPSISTLREKTDIEGIEVERDNTGRINCILFSNAEIGIAKPISEEERKELARISEKKADEFVKRQYEIVRKYL